MRFYVCFLQQTRTIGNLSIKLKKWIKQRLFTIIINYIKQFLILINNKKILTTS